MDATVNGRADVIILSSAIGSGHMRASAALVSGMGLLDDAVTCKVLDFPHEVSPRIESALRTVYLDALKLWPSAYGRLYRSSGGSHAQTYQHYLGEPGIRKLEGLSEATGAKAFLAPHFYGADVLGGYKKLHPETFCSVVITDYQPHPLGLPDNLDLYIVADDAAAEQVVRLGAPEANVHPTGIPIDPHFEEPADPEAGRDLLGLSAGDDLPVALVMGGGLGGGAMNRVVSTLLEVSPSMHLVVLCGSNDQARAKLEVSAKRRGHPATFLGFTDRVRDLMEVASVLVSKPGGLSCTEALACGLPQVLFHPIPGNEEENAAAMIRYGAAVLVERQNELLAETLKILTSHETRERMSDAAREAHRPNSAVEGARLVMEGVVR